VIANSPAKINLFLHVVGKRQDGYHFLESLFAPLQLSDTIGISSSDEVSCTVDGAAIEDNIVIKAANLLKSELKVKAGCKILITKNIPIGAGLGGGS
jgi:4-diphosphocytidyl-2-C-methyl-D-erythritol kinase